MRFTYINDEGYYVISIDGSHYSFDGDSSSVGGGIQAIQGYPDGLFEIEFTDRSQRNEKLYTRPDFIDMLINEWDTRNQLEIDLLKTTEKKLEEGIISRDEYDIIKITELQEWRNTAVVSKFQAKAALYQSGMLETVQTHMETADPIAQMAWEDAQEFRRYSPTMNALAVELEMTEEQLDDLFRLAATVEA